MTDTLTQKTDTANAEERALKDRTQALRGALQAPLASEPRVHVLLLSCNRVDHIERVFQQLAATEYRNYAVYIMDNGSTDGAWDIVQKAREYFPEQIDMIVTWLPFNVGRPAGHNLMLTQHDHSMADFIAIVDDDLVQIPPDWLRRMVATFGCFPQAAVVGGKALSPGTEKIIHGGVRRLCKFTDSEIELTNSADCPDMGQFDFVDKVDHVIGCLNLYRAEPLLNHIGLFDVRYSPCGLVDLDHHLCARHVGYEVIYNGLIEFVHARVTGTAALADNALLGNVLGNRTKLLHKFSVAHMEELMAATARLRHEWLAQTN